MKPIINSKVITTSLVFLYLFFTVAPPAYAWNLTSFGSGDVGNVMDSAFDSLGIDKDELDYSIRSMNVARYKKNPPQVDLTFEPVNPDEGEKVTVVAAPTNFMNDSKDLYFTWFFKQAKCTDNHDSNYRYKSSCDLNNDGKVNIEDHKIKAMRIIVNDDFDWENADYSQSSDNDGYRAIYGGDDQRDKKEYCYVHDTSTGEEYLIDCGHLFPNAPRETTGDGSFKRGEESFWHTDPNADDTAHTGNVDEANVAGLGITTFSWNYSLGDEVGVVVEGVSPEATQTQDASYRTTWAMNKMMCDVDDAGDIDEADDLNVCLYDNLISPAENGPQSEKLNINLSYSPSSPINDSSSYSDSALSEGDDLNVTASIINADDSNYLQYSWEVFASNEVNPDGWGNAFLKSELPLSTQMVGLGLDTFKFKLNLSSPKKYLRVKLTVRENVGTNLYREGREDVVIPINSTTEQIKAYSALVSDSSLRLSLSTDERCQSGMERAVCPVSKNEIMGVNVSSNSLSDFLWTIDGKPFVYQSCFFTGCDPLKQTNVAYFPILKELGERYIINLTATNQVTGAKVNLSRTFEVTDPQITISSADESVCKPALLGSYVDLNGQKWPDYSEINFWALTDSSFKLSASTIGFSVSLDKYTWLIDGNSVDASNASSFGFNIDDNGILTLPPKYLGESYEVSVETLYSQSDAVKRALNEYWGVGYGQFYEDLVSSHITVTMQGSAESANQSLNKKILATVSSAIPSYLAFLLRIVLTTMIILFTSKFILSFSNTKN